MLSTKTKPELLTKIEKNKRKHMFFIKVNKHNVNDHDLTERSWGKQIPSNTLSSTLSLKLSSLKKAMIAFILFVLFLVLKNYVCISYIRCFFFVVLLFPSSYYNFFEIKNHHEMKCAFNCFLFLVFKWKNNENFIVILDWILTFKFGKNGWGHNGQNAESH